MFIILEIYLFYYRLRVDRSYAGLGIYYRIIYIEYIFGIMGVRRYRIVLEKVFF